jgi:hypothetical protein
LKNVTTHGFIFLVISMIVIITIQVLSWQSDIQDKKDLAKVQNSATIDRQSLKNLIADNGAYVKEVGNYLSGIIKQTYFLVNTTNTNEQLANATNQTNNLVKFLTDNFGANSDYLVRENFQYKQANDTFSMMKQISRELADIKLMLNSTH